MAKRFKSKIRFLLWFLILLLLFGAIVGFVVSRNDTVKVDKFSVSVNGNIVTSDSGGYFANKDNPLLVNVLYPSTTQNTTYEYSLKCVADNDFEYFVDYEKHMYSDLLLNVYDFFDISLTEEGLLIVPKDNDIEGLLNVCYPSREIYVSETAVDYSKDLFALTIKSSSGEVIVVGFGLKPTIKGILLDKNEVVF